MEQESHPYQHFADRPIIDRDLVPLYDLTPEDYQRIVNDLVNLVGAVLGYVQERGGQGLAQAVASDSSAILMDCRPLPLPSPSAATAAAMRAAQCRSFTRRLALPATTGSKGVNRRRFGGYMDRQWVLSICDLPGILVYVASAPSKANGSEE
jgi:hypothetical protein